MFRLFLWLKTGVRSIGILQSPNAIIIGSSIPPYKVLADSLSLGRSMVDDSVDPLQYTPMGSKINKQIMACSLLVSLTCIFPGYDIGLLTPEFGNKMSDDLNFTRVEIIIFCVCFPLFYLLAVLAAARTADWIGRRYTLLFSCTIFFAGSVLMCSATNFAFFMVGHFCSAVGGGYAFMVAPVYIAEISSPVSSRGFLTSLPEVFLSAGALLAAISTYCLPKIVGYFGWRYMVGIAAVASVFLCIGLSIMISESPHWLVMKDRLEDAKRLLDRTSSSMEESQLRFEDIRKAVANSRNTTTFFHAFKELVIHPSTSVRHMLVTALVIQFLQQAIGISVVNLFSINIVEKAGVRREIHQLLITCAFGLTGIVCNLVATVLVDKLGRRILLLYSVAGMVVSLFGLAVGVTTIYHYSDQKITWALAICIICSLCCIIFFSTGIGPIVLIYSSEVFPTRLRALGSGMAVAMNFFASAIVMFSFLLVMTHIPSFNLGKFFFMYSGIALSGWIFIYLFLPETKGTSLQDMERLFVGLGTFSGDRIRNWIRNGRVLPLERDPPDSVGD
ncbi:OLC1v1036947C1 [Oldenlandia corymbosa var. corymbosa]|uniref:OLC1v1036947C1 n=1 Tax=Oldenlandia corymbosa var. corymbosa TaxID=529605 RepID=A0AAV1CZ71_OLDCO|nr:OLC1v1036947C1 [Oldenlandia corymbosa var. corymbosa]